jgi:hypothetical protein
MEVEGGAMGMMTSSVDGDIDEGSKMGGRLRKRRTL